MPASDQKTNTYDLRRESRTAEVPETRPQPWRRRLAVAGIIVGALADVGIAFAVWHHLTFVPTLSARVQSSVIRLAPRLDGRMQEVCVTENEEVRKGQVVARLDNRELKASLEAAQAELTMRQSALKEARAEEMLSRAEVGADIAMAEARVAVVSARVASLKEQVELDRQRLPVRIQQAEAVVAQREAEVERVVAGPREEEIESARERVASAQATLALYDLEVTQSQELVDEGIDSAYTLEVRKTRLETQRHTLKQAQLQLKLLESGPRQEDVKIADESLAQARAALAQVKLGRQELVKLKSDLAVAEAELLETQAALRQAQARDAEIVVAEQQTKAAAAEIERQLALVSGRQAALADMDIVSPVSGTVTRVYADVGEFCPKGTAVVLVSDSSKTRWIDAFVDEEDARLLSVGQKAQLNVPANSSTRIEARVTQVGLHTATLDAGGEGAAGATAFNQPDRVWLKLVPVEPLDPSIVTGTTARGRIRVR